MRRLLIVVSLLASPAAATAQDTGWVIDRMAVRLEIQSDGSVIAREAIDVDFGTLERRGIFRDLLDRFDYDATHTRRYEIGLESVTAADGRAHQVRTEREGAATRFRIGNPNQTLSGAQTYRIVYTIGGALNPFTTHDELYWNATSVWPVPVRAASIVVTAPAEAITRVQCHGPRGPAESCEARFTPGEAVFTATRPLAPGEQLTIVVGLRKGAVPEPQPRLVAKPRSIQGFFEPRPDVLGLTAVGTILVVAGVVWLWWTVGRDRRFQTLYRGGDGGDSERVPLFGGRPIAVEFEPPGGIRPGQMGLLVDERADTLDMTATIVDLASRGYLTITELPKKGWFGKRDWRLDKLKPADAQLLEYERIVFNGLFGHRDTTEVSDLKNKFHTTLAKAKAALYRDSVERGWFSRNPSVVRRVSRVIGLGAMAMGVGLVVFLGSRWGAGLLGLPAIAGGLLLAIFAGAMPRRTPAGREMLRQTLGFAKYIRTGEVRQQEFAERANIFTAYLPYAVAFRCVDRWARAFKDIDLQQATAGWYAGSSGFDAHRFSSDLGSFSSSVSSTLASTPGGSGGSGFSGGSSGGGGGGGGGGSW